MITAITGTIGSGKSAVCRILKELGYEVLSCDELNAKLLTEASYISLIDKEFEGVVKNGIIDKKTLASIIFSDEEKRKKLNSIAHPKIKDKIVERIKDLNGDIFVEVPLLGESGMVDLFDKIWFVTCGRDKQISRIVNRDRITEEEAKKRLEVQERKYDYSAPVSVILNDGDLNDLKNTVSELL